MNVASTMTVQNVLVWIFVFGLNAGQEPSRVRVNGKSKKWREVSRAKEKGGK